MKREEVSTVSNYHKIIMISSNGKETLKVSSCSGCTIHWWNNCLSQHDTVGGARETFDDDDDEKLFWGRRFSAKDEEEAENFYGILCGECFCAGFWWWVYTIKLSFNPICGSPSIIMLLKYANENRFWCSLSLRRSFFGSVWVLLWAAFVVLHRPDSLRVTLFIINMGTCLAEFIASR